MNAQLTKLEAVDLLLEADQSLSISHRQINVLIDAHMSKKSNLPPGIKNKILGQIDFTGYKREVYNLYEQSFTVDQLIVMRESYSPGDMNVYNENMYAIEDDLYEIGRKLGKASNAKIVQHLALYR